MASSLIEWRNSKLNLVFMIFFIYRNVPHYFSFTLTASFNPSSSSSMKCTALFLFYAKCIILSIINLYRTLYVCGLPPPSFSSSSRGIESICVVTSDGRIILGDLVGHDQLQNLILNDAKERIYSNVSSPEILDLGLYVIRGDNVCMIADYNSDLWTDDPVAPLAPIRQQEKI